MPRGRDECWLEVTRTRDEDTNKRHPRVTCKHCLTEWTSNEKARVIEHLQRCNQLPEALWHTYQAHRLDPTLPSATDIQQQQQQQRPQQRPQQQRARARGIAPSTSPADQDIAVAACAQWIHDTGLNLTVIEHPAFKTFVQALRPTFNVPTRQQLTHAMFDAPLTLIAYFADRQERHRRPALLDSSEEIQSRSLQAFILRYCDDNAHKAVELLSMLSLLRFKQGPFGNGMMWMGNNQMNPTQLPPIHWWHTYWLERQQSELAELCILALVIAPNGDTLERSWSPQNFMQEMERSQLSQELVNKLFVAFWSLRIKHGWVDESADASHEPMEQDADFTPDVNGFPGMHV